MASFQERKTCYVLDAPQLSKDWHQYRVGRATSSTLGTWIGVDPFNKFNTTFIEKSVLKLGRDKELTHHLRRGLEKEPIIRELYAKHIGKTLLETSLAIWKDDDRFAGSLDFEIEGTREGGEIKAPGRRYAKMVEYFNAHKKGYIPIQERNAEEKEIKHIYGSHYVQMIGNAVITDKDWMHYVIMDDEVKNELYYDVIPVDHEYWNRVYEHCCILFDEHVDPIMKKYNVKRLPVP